MYRYFLSWRYLRVRRTNYIGIVGIFVGVGALILILSIMAGFLDESRKSVRGSLADIIIEPTVSLMGSVQDPEPFLEIVRARPEVAGATAQLHWYGIMTVGGWRTSSAPGQLADPSFTDLSGVHLIGLDPEDELATTEFKTNLTREGPKNADGVPRSDNRVANPDDPFAPPPGYDPVGRPLDTVIVGEQLMYRLSIVPGDIIQMILPVPTKNGREIRPNTREFVVGGSYHSGENEIDLGRIFVQREQLMDLVGGKAQFSQILVKLKDYETQGEQVTTELHSELVQAGLIKKGNQNAVRTWEQFRQSLIGAIENEKTLMGIMLSLVLIVSGFTIFAILSMLVTEKRRDIGILAALGATPRGIMTLFLLIGCWDALLGATSGAIVGVWLAYKIDPIEVWLSESLGIHIFNREVYLFDHIPSVVDPTGVALIVLGAFVCTLLFAAIPALKAARMHPIDALRYE